MHLGFSGEFINFMVYKSMDGIHTLIPNIDFGKTLKFDPRTGAKFLWFIF